MTKFQLHISVLVLIALCSGGCAFVGGLKSRLDERPATKTMRSVDGKSALKVPRSWFTKNQLNEQAKLQAADVAANQYVIVISESKKNFGRAETLDDYTASIIDAKHDQITGYKASAVTQFRLGRYDAQQFEVTGAVEKTRLKWLFTTVDAPKNFHQIMIWTTEANFEASEKLFEEIVESFEETEGKPLGEESND